MLNRFMRIPPSCERVRWATTDTCMAARQLERAVLDSFFPAVGNAFRGFEGCVAEVEPRCLRT